MFAATLLCQVLLATAAFASKEHFAHRRAAVATHQSQPKQIIEAAHVVEGNAQDIEHTFNWAGAVLSKKKPTYKSVTGTFVVPKPREPSGASGLHYAAAWVGIDGMTCGKAILQTGVTFQINGGTVTYGAWYEWWPNNQVYFSDISFKAGDTVELTVVATSKTSGKATVTNKSSNRTVSHSFSGEKPLCQYDAEWIVEDLGNPGHNVPFADFGRVTFTDAKAGTLSGSRVGTSGASLLTIKQNNKVLTSVSHKSGHITVTYVG
ncbi:aspergillopepsin [Ganoderma leucocontextum]|nr:aspergillopepsin [Ganoderma leucocontextum]